MKMQMDPYHIQPVILCGGSGTRLWPISTSQTPKQFISLGKRGTLLEETIRRVSLMLPNNQKSHKPLLIMHASHKLPSELSAHESNVIYEPYANDTAVAVARAALEIKQRHPNENTIMLVLPADHYIYNVEACVRDITNGLAHVTSDNIVLYGIDPTGPESKYGYIIPNDDGVHFKEKPAAAIALELMNRGALWNSGIFAASTDLVLKCLQNSPYDIMNWITTQREGKAVSFDIAVLQEHRNIYAHHCSGWRWSDVGTWESFTDIPEIKAEMKEAQSIIMADCTNSHVLKRSPGNIVLIGCKDLFVVTSGSDVLIMPNTGDYNNELKDIATRIGK